MNHLICIGVARKISQIQNIFNVDLFASLLVDLRFIFLDYLHDAASHRAVSHYCNFNHNLLTFCRIFRLILLSFTP